MSETLTKLIDHCRIMGQDPSALEEIQAHVGELQDFSDLVAQTFQGKPFSEEGSYGYWQHKNVREEVERIHQCGIDLMQQMTDGLRP